MPKNDISKRELLELLPDEQRAQYESNMAQIRESLCAPIHSNLCDQCGRDVSFLNLAHLSYRYGSFKFCTGACMEEWLDELQEMSEDQ